MTSTNHEGSAAGYLPMNPGHLAFLSSDAWAQMVQADLLPWLTRDADLGDDVLELGPGPGRTTDLLRQHAARVTAVELDARLVGALDARFAGTNVEVLHGDGARTGLAADRFSSVTCFHVLHHVPDAAHQDRLFAEACRVLRPGGTFLVADALDQPATRERHEEERETFVPLDPQTLPERLAGAGFDRYDLEQGDYQLLCRARKAERVDGDRLGR
jgi:SAM-dependent methyltransferase